MKKRILFSVLSFALLLKMGHATTSCTGLSANYDGTCANDPGFDTCAGVQGKNGWGGMTNNFAQADAFSCGTDPYGGNQVINNTEPNTPASAVHSGVQSWWFKRGYDSAGTGTACSALCPTCDETSGIFEYSLWFKSADPSCSDGSRMAVIPAPSDCSDRSNLYLEIKNTAEHGLEVVTYEHNEQGTWGGDYVRHHADPPLDCDSWHHLKCTITEDENSHSVTSVCSVDDVEFSMGATPFFTRARQIAGYGYTPSSRVKFQPRHPNHDASYKGFIFDDLKVSYTKDSVTSSYETSFEASSYGENTVCQNVECSGDPSGGKFDLTCAADGEWSGRSCLVLNTCRDVSDLYESNACGPSTGNQALAEDGSKTCGELRNMYVDADCCHDNLDKTLN